VNANYAYQSLEPTERELVNVLLHRYGDGTVYQPKGASVDAFLSCRHLGFISDDGFITRQGRVLIATHGQS
jgi:hypothetical protein